MAERIILDTDIGTDVDDAYALAFLANSPEIKIEAVTTVWADPVLRARLAKKHLNLLGKPDIPVAAGEADPMEGGRPSFLMGNEGKGALDDDEELALSETPALELIESLLRKYPNEIKILAIGPMSNLGKLLSRKPELASLIKEFVIMGGLPFYGPKEIERFGERPAELNLTVDPHASRTMFECGAPITLVGANVTLPTLLKPEHVERIKRHGTPATDFLYDMTMEWFKVMDIDRTPMHDPLAVAAAFTLDYLETMMVNVVIETEGRHTTGLTVVSRYDDERYNTVRVATDVKIDEFIEFMLGRILV